MSEAFKELRNYIGMPVLVKVKGGKEFRGILRSYDQHLNVVLDNTEEIEGDNRRLLGRVLIRGDNIVIVSPAKLE